MNLLEELEQFRFEANQQGYFVEKEPVKEKDGSFTYIYEKGDWKFHDNFFGGEPYGGRVIIFYKNKPYWMMVYYGFVEESLESINEVYSFLRKAVKHGGKGQSIERGPKLFIEGHWKYTNEWQGAVTNFSGIEHIYFEGKHAFQTTYAGGLVDQRGGF